MFDAQEILKATGGRLLMGGRHRAFSGVSTDSRKIEGGQLFVAIEGRNFDGGAFVGEARSKGAPGAVVRRNREWSEFERADFVIIEVEDSVRALGDIARFHRMRFDIPIIAVTGSNGKTTAKEMIWSVLSMDYAALKNEGTENNFIGLPLTLFRLNDATDMAVLELGSNHSGEIARLGEIVQPSCGVILNAGASHLEFFGSVENVRQEKLELLKRLGGGFCVVNGDDEEMAKRAKSACEEVITFGLNEGCAFRAADIKESEDGIEFVVNGRDSFRLGVLGRHNVHNALAAIAVGSAYGVKFGAMSESLERFKPPPLRMERAEAGGVTFIFDCYNSNPASMAGAIETLKGMSFCRRRIAILGDMLELGSESPYYHRQVGRSLASAGVDILVGVGPLSRYILEGARGEGIGGEALLHFENSADAARALKDMLREGDLVLVKGSRAMNMEEIKKCFTICSTR